MLKRLLARLGSWFSLLAFWRGAPAALPAASAEPTATLTPSWCYFGRLVRGQQLKVGEFIFIAGPWYRLSAALAAKIRECNSPATFDICRVENLPENVYEFMNDGLEPSFIDLDSVSWELDMAPPRHVEQEATTQRRRPLRFPNITPAWPTETRDAGEFLVRVKPDLGTKTVTPVGWHTLEADRWYVIGPRTAELLQDVETLQVVTRDEARALDKFQPHDGPPPFVPPQRKLGQSVESWTAIRDEAKRQHDLVVESMSHEVELLAPPAPAPTRPVFDSTPDGRADLLVRIKPSSPTKTLCILADREYPFHKSLGWYQVPAKVADLCDRDTFNVCTQEQAIALDAYEKLLEERRGVT